MLTRLQKVDKDTNELIDMVKEYLFSVGVRTSKERAWDIFQTIHQLPYRFMVERNKEIKYQGQGMHITHKYGNQLLTIKNIGKFELKAVSVKKDSIKRPTIKFTPSAEIRSLIEENVKVIDNGEEV